jgi:hypothetical protein
LESTKWGSNVGRIYSDGDQEAVCLSAIEALSRETSRPFDEVKEVYEGEFARLRDGARVTDYLVLFASRRTRDMLSQRRH